MPERRWLTPPQIARQLGVSPDTIASFIRSGELRAVNLARPGAHRRRYHIAPEELDRFLASRATSPPPPPPPRRRKPSAGVIKFF